MDSKIQLSAKAYPSAAQKRNGSAYKLQIGRMYFCVFNRKISRCLFEGNILIFRDKQKLPQPLKQGDLPDMAVFDKNGALPEDGIFIFERAVSLHVCRK